MRLPSGETVGFCVHLSVNRTGSPPSIETFHTLAEPEREDEKTTQRLSGEDCGKISPGPSVSCLRLPPSGSMRQMLLVDRARVDVKRMERPSGVANREL